MHSLGAGAVAALPVSSWSAAKRVQLVDGFFVLVVQLTGEPTM